MKTGWQTAWLIGFSILIGLMAAGLILLVASPPRGQAVQLRPAPSPADIVVHIAGAVASPGIYSLPAGSRVEDAVTAAGGLLAEANPQTINLAAHLQDGDQVTIAEAASSEEAMPSGSTRAGEVIKLPELIDINTASLEELDQLPEIGPSIAEKIIAYRQEHGPFQTTEAIQDVNGIGPGIYDRIKDLITVSPAP